MTSERIPTCWPTVVGVASWPGVVGLTPKQAEPIIKQSNPLVSICVHPVGGVVTKDIGHLRVRLFVDKKGKIVRVPKIG